jgi:hypothetical protein
LYVYIYLNLLGCVILQPFQALLNTDLTRFTRRTIYPCSPWYLGRIFPLCCLDLIRQYVWNNIVFDSGSCGYFRQYLIGILRHYPFDLFTPKLSWHVFRETQLELDPKKNLKAWISKNSAKKSEFSTKAGSMDCCCDNLEDRFFICDLVICVISKSFTVMNRWR